MNKELFLIAALSLPPTHFKVPMIRVEQSDEIKKLHDFIHRIAPGAEITITPPDQKMPEWEHLPFRWRGLDVWIKRAPITDRKIKASA